MTPNEKVYPTDPRVSRSVRLAWTVQEAVEAFEEDIHDLTQKELVELYERLSLSPGKHHFTKMIASGRAYDLAHKIDYTEVEEVTRPLNISAAKSKAARKLRQLKNGEFTKEELEQAYSEAVDAGNRGNIVLISKEPHTLGREQE